MIAVTADVPAAAHVRRGEAITAALLFAPCVAFLVALFILPVIYVLVLSVTDPAPSLQHFVRIFTVPIYLKILWNTFVTSLIVTLACLALGYPLAYVIARRNDCARARAARHRRHELLDRLPRAHLCLARDPRQSRPGRGLYAALGLGTAAAAAVHLVQLDVGHDAHPPALHGARALWRDAQDRSDPPARGARASARGRSRAFRHVFLPLSLPGVVNGSRAGLHHLPRLLRHADPARHAARHDDLAADQPADRGAAGLGLRRGARGRAADLRRWSCSRIYNRFVGLDRLWG